MLWKSSLTASLLLLTVLAPVSAQQFRMNVMPPPAAFSANNLVRLLRRPEVQNHIRLTLRQKQALAALLDNPNNAGVRVQLRAQGRTSPEEMRQQAEEQIASYQSGLEKQIAEILRPEQMKRLHELDLQWQGAVALGNAKISDEVQIKPEHRAEIAKITAQYQADRSQTLMELARQDTSGNARGGRIMRRIQLNTRELDNPLSPTRKKLDALRKEAEEKILGLLSPEEKERWQQAQGDPFKFRMDQPNSWR